MLTRNDVIDVLSAIASGDRRTVGEADITLWARALEFAGVDSKPDILQAVVQHYAESADWLMPVHVIRRVKAIRAARLALAPDEGALMAGVDPDDPNWTRIYRERRRVIADGRPLVAIQGGAS